MLSKTLVHYVGDNPAPLVILLALLERKLLFALFYTSARRFFFLLLQTNRKERSSFFVHFIFATSRQYRNVVLYLLLFAAELLQTDLLLLWQVRKFFELSRVFFCDEKIFSFALKYCVCEKKKLLLFVFCSKFFF